MGQKLEGFLHTFLPLKTFFIGLLFLKVGPLKKLFGESIYESVEVLEKLPQSVQLYQNYPKSLRILL